MQKSSSLPLLSQEVRAIEDMVAVAAALMQPPPPPVLAMPDREDPGHGADEVET